MYLLDTNACIRILNNSSESLVDRLRQQSPENLFLCSVVKAELVYGAYRSSYLAANLRILKSFFEPFISLPFDDSCLDQYGRIRSDLERVETPIGPYDLMIAATALAYDLILVTNNTREFSRVAGLQIEDRQLE
jgi:tRNA(fMet)-specific endonuclease VapC